MKYWIAALCLLGFSATTIAADTFIGTLNGQPTYDRISTGDVSPTCTATSTFSGIGVGIPYVAVPIYTPVGENLVATINAAGTDVSDTTLSLYCDPFDPAAADLNLVAYDDDGAGNLLSAFDGSEGAFMNANEQYYLVVSLFSPGSIAGGNFQLDLGGQILVGSPVIAPPIAIPTLSSWSLILLAGMLGFTTVWYHRRRV